MTFRGQEIDIGRYRADQEYRHRSLEGLYLGQPQRLETIHRQADSPLNNKYAGKYHQKLFFT